MTLHPFCPDTAQPWCDTIFHGSDDFRNRAVLRTRRGRFVTSTDRSRGFWRYGFSCRFALGQDLHAGLMFQWRLFVMAVCRCLMSMNQAGSQCYFPFGTTQLFILILDLVFFSAAAATFESVKVEESKVGRR